MPVRAFTIAFDHLHKPDLTPEWAFLFWTMFSFSVPSLLALSAASLSQSLYAQEGASLSLNVTDGRQPLAAATVELLSDSLLVKIAVADSNGSVFFRNLAPRSYRLRVSHSGYTTVLLPSFTLTAGEQRQLPSLQLEQKGTLSGVTVTARKPFVEQRPGKTVVNLEAAITLVGSTVAEALERLPGVSLDRDGNLALKGRPGVAVFIDGKPTNLSGAELATLLQGMSAAGISQIELMDLPPARYDAAGGAGAINIITKKERQRGFNGSISAALSQGVYPKTNNSVQVALRRDRWNLSAGYSVNAARGFTRIEALRTYFGPDGRSTASLLAQPSLMKNRNHTHNLRGSADYTLGKRTSAGFSFNALLLDRKGSGHNEALWKDALGRFDSLLLTNSRTGTRWNNGGVGLNLRHNITAQRQLSFDADAQWYRFSGDQLFLNSALQPTPYTEGVRASLPGKLRILSARADYSLRLRRWNFETGVRWADTRTGNEVRSEAGDGQSWSEDLGRSNHFVYHERIGAAYGSAETRAGQWTLQGGLRFEGTRYDARQLGNAIVKDSSFSRSYASLFPTLLATWRIDSSHTLSFSAGRRIDRPPFQKLNPFSVFINKYTVQRGNPFFRPQYSWNAEIAHDYKGWLHTTAGYSRTTDYFAQLFPVDPGGLVVYTEGNLGCLEVWSLSVGVQKAPLRWWNLNGNLLLQHKLQEGFVERLYTARITQATANLTNNFRFGKGWSAELSGQYTSRSQQDIQEIVDPAGQVALGVSKTLLKGRGTLRLTSRDLFYTQWMKGTTYFRGVEEWFKLTRDTRIATLNFQWRFGQNFRQNRRTRNAAETEVQRVGNG